MTASAIAKELAYKYIRNARHHLQGLTKEGARSSP